MSRWLWIRIKGEGWALIRDGLSRQSSHGWLFQGDIYTGVLLHCCLSVFGRVLFAMSFNTILPLSGAFGGPDSMIVDIPMFTLKYIHKVNRCTQELIRSTSSSKHQRERQTNSLKQPRKEQIASRADNLYPKRWQLCYPNLTEYILFLHNC